MAGRVARAYVAETQGVYQDPWTIDDIGARIDEIVMQAEATFLVRDLVNIPAGDLGPAELEMAVLALADETGAKVSVTRDEALTEGYPMVAAVG